MRGAGAAGGALEGRGYAEFCALPLAEQARAAEMDSVVCFSQQLNLGFHD